MSTYNHLKKFLFRFSENVGVVYTLDEQVPHKIDRVDSKGIYIKADEALGG